MPDDNSQSNSVTLVVQDPNETLQALTTLDRAIQDVDEDIVAKRAALDQARKKREEMVQELRKMIRSAYNPMPLLPLFDGPSIDGDGPARPDAPRDSEDLGGPAA